MTLSLADIAYLSSHRGRHVLESHAHSDVSAANTLAMLTQLRKALSPQQAAAVLSTLRLRKKAKLKFPHQAQRMLFTEESLQQASHPRIRQYRADLLGSDELVDMCCGIGSDSMAYAESGRRVLGLDKDPVRIAIARHNAAALGVSAEFAVADVRAGMPSGYDAAFYDPSRRDARGRRIRDVERYVPPLSLIRRWPAKELVVKLSPAIALAQVQRYGGQLEFISVDGGLSEAVLWRHRQSAPPLATRLDAAGIHHLSADYDAHVDISEPRAWLFEPDPAILRARLLRQLAATLAASLLDGRIAYLTLDEIVDSPWGRYWQILDWMPFNLKKLRRYLADRGVGQVTVKKRGFPMLPEELIARLRLKQGEESRVLVLTRCRARPIVIVCAPK
ncbi:MAG: methyltransferase domain-containing protein [Chloroflexi bacterium]|nr:methyltransferase domain-containing protein [Chloroflexota bacterium]